MKQLQRYRDLLIVATFLRVLAILNLLGVFYFGSRALLSTIWSEPWAWIWAELTTAFFCSLAGGGLWLIASLLSLAVDVATDIRSMADKSDEKEPKPHVVFTSDMPLPPPRA